MPADSIPWNVHIYCYGDLEMLTDAAESVPSHVPIHVFDGRYHSFPGDTNLTPGLEEFCDDHPDCIYYAPPPDRLPFGDPNTPGEWRSAVNEKAQWAFEHLPESEWTLKLDADERLREINPEAFTDYNPHGKYCPVINMAGDPLGEVFIARIWQPRYWTPWINDCLLPRDILPRDASLERLHTAWYDYPVLRFKDRYETDAVHIENHGADRPRGYLERREEHLETIGREERAAEIREILDANDTTTE